MSRAPANGSRTATPRNRPARWAAGGVLLLLAATGCGGAGGGPEPRQVAGCYYFDRDDAADPLRLPWGIRLRATPLEPWPATEARGEAYRAATLTGRTEEDHPFGFWAAFPPDSLEVGYPGGGAITLRLAFDDRDLVGTARPVGDVLRPGQEPGPREAHPVRLLWARCPND